MKMDLRVISLGLLAASCATAVQRPYPALPEQLLQVGDEPELVEIQLAPDGEALLDLAVKDMLTRDELSFTRYTRGGKGWSTSFLGGSRYVWPDSYLPSLPGIDFVRVPWDYRPDGELFLGLDIRSLVVDGDKANASFVMHDYGVRVIGGMFIDYGFAKRGGKWTIVSFEAFDP